MDLTGLHYLYEVRNRVNEKRYFGVTNNYKRRMYWHQKNLADGQHSNSHLQRAYDLYGASSFEYNMLGVAFSELDICLDEMAAIWKHYPACYNKLLGVPWTKYTPQTSIKKDVKKPEPLLMARIKKAKKKKKTAKRQKKSEKARKRKDRKEMLKRVKKTENKKLKDNKPIINKIDTSDMFELRMESIILKAKKELKK